MKIVVISAFRNMLDRVRDYMDRIVALRRALKVEGGGSVRVIAVEGDSTDGTADRLDSEALRLGIDLDRVTHDHGLRVFGSTEHADRLEALTGVMMAGMNAVRETDDALLYIESDLRWTPDMVLAALRLSAAREDGFDVVSPMIFCGARFYDVFAFRRDGERFSQQPPYHPSLRDTGITEVDSVGSCLTMRAEVARVVNPEGLLGLVSWCAGARAQGFRIGVAPHLRVEHPPC